MLLMVGHTMGTSSAINVRLVGTLCPVGSVPTMLVHV